MFTVYVLYSVEYDKIYIGYTSDIEMRLASHNEFGKGYTKKFRPWVIAFVEEYETTKEAMRRERVLKSGKRSRVYLELYSRQAMKMTLFYKL